MIHLFCALPLCVLTWLKNHFPCDRKSACGLGTINQFFDTKSYYKVSLAFRDSNKVAKVKNKKFQLYPSPVRGGLRAPNPLKGGFRPLGERSLPFGGVLARCMGLWASPVRGGLRAPNPPYGGNPPFGGPLPSGRCTASEKEHTRWAHANQASQHWIQVLGT